MSIVSFEPPVQLITTPIPEITSNGTNSTVTNKYDPSSDVGTVTPTMTTTITASNPNELPVFFASPRRNYEEENSIENPFESNLTPEKDDGNPFA